MKLHVGAPALVSGEPEWSGVEEFDVCSFLTIRRSQSFVMQAGGAYRFDAVAVGAATIDGLTNLDSSSRERRKFDAELVTAQACRAHTPERMHHVAASVAAGPPQFPLRRAFQRGAPAMKCPTRRAAR